MISVNRFNVVFSFCFALLAVSSWSQDRPAAETGLGALAQSGIEGAIVVLDLVKFNPGGEAKYDEYDAGAEAKVKDLGGEVILRGHSKTVEGLDSTQWDRLTLRKYPSPQAVLQMGSSSEYQSVLPLRMQAVERSFVYAFVVQDVQGQVADPSRIAAPNSHDAVFMLNLLRFKPEGGREKYYGQYGAGVTPLMAKSCDRPVLRMKGVASVIADETIDDCILVVYPSDAAFRAMITSDDYRAIAHYRTESIELGLIWPFSFK